MDSTKIVAVMGITGAGKSTFVKLVTGDASVKIGHGQAAETKAIKGYGVTVQGRRFTLVDTPGFDDEDLSDSDVLKMLVEWLASTYRLGQKLSGIIYLHRISEPRMRGSSLRNLTMFQALIGDDFYENVTLATSCWSLVPFSVGLERERELKTNTSFWKLMLSNKARLERIPDNMTDAQALVYRAGNHAAMAVKTQRDRVDRGMSFDDLAVTKLVNYEVEKLKRELEAERARQMERLAREEREMQERLLELRESNQRVLDAARRRQWCSWKRPAGLCDKLYCFNKLQRYKVTYHCCSCRLAGDDYWQCGPCGNDCGNDEHPYMSRIENDDDCVVM